MCLYDSHSAIALFYVRHPSDWPAAGSESSRVLSLDLGKPVIDFIHTAAGHFWVLTDGEWVLPSTSEAMSSEDRKEGVRLVGWTEAQSGWSVSVLPFAMLS